MKRSNYLFFLPLLLLCFFLPSPAFFTASVLLFSYSLSPVFSFSFIFSSCLFYFFLLLSNYSILVQLACLFARLPVFTRLPLCLFASMRACLFACVLVNMPARLHICLFIYSLDRLPSPSESSSTAVTDE